MIPTLRSRGRGLAPTALLLLTACGLASGPTRWPTPDGRASLERSFADDPGHRETAYQLSAARLVDGDTAGAREALEAAADGSGDPAAILLEALLAEERGATGRALERMTAYLSTSHGSFRSQVAGRVERLEREGLDEAARALLARESELSVRRPRPDRVAVMPFRTDGDDPDLRALAASYTEMLTADAGATGDLTAVDPRLVRAVLRSMDAPPESWSRPEVADRLGRLLGAGLVVQGGMGLTEGDLRVHGSLVTLGVGGREVTPILEEVDPVMGPVLQYRLVFLLYQEAGFPLSSQQRRRIQRLHTRSSAAWVTLGRGLLADDAGNQGEAEDRYREADALANGPFDHALDLLQRLDRIRSADQPAPSLAWEVAQVEVQRTGVRAHRAVPGSAYRTMLDGFGNERRPFLAELLGQDRLGVGSFVDLVITVDDGGAP